MQPTDHEQTPESFQPVAGVLAFLLPGLGHAYLGDPKRGLLIGVGVLGLFVGGLLIGGVDVVDSREDFWWFVGQAPVGPVAFAVDRVNQTYMKATDPSPTDPHVQSNPRGWFETHPVRRVKSVGHMNEIGSLFATIAGMLNAVCIIDAVWHAPRRRRATPLPAPAPAMTTPAGEPA